MGPPPEREEILVQWSLVKHEHGKEEWASIHVVYKNPNVNCILLWSILIGLFIVVTYYEKLLACIKFSSNYSRCMMTFISWEFSSFMYMIVLIPKSHKFDTCNYYKLSIIPLICVKIYGCYLVYFSSFETSTDYIYITKFLLH